MAWTRFGWNVETMVVSLPSVVAAAAAAAAVAKDCYRRKFFEKRPPEPPHSRQGPHSGSEVQAEWKTFVVTPLWSE
jgi:hypothetical protein